MPNKSLVGFLVRKYLRFDKSQPFITISALLAFLGVAVGLMVLIVAMAIMNGFDKEFERKLFTMNYPLSIYSYGKGALDKGDLDKLQNEFPTLKMSPFISTQAIAKYSQKLEGVLLFGVDFQKEKAINSVVKDALQDKAINNFNLLLGSGIKDNFLLNKGQKITLIFTKNDPGGMALIPRMKRFIYREDFTSGLIAYDKIYMYTTLESLQKILNYKKDTYDGIHIFSKEPFKDIKRIGEKLPPLSRVVGWWQQNGNFFSALKMEKRALFIVLMLIILVASLNIVSSLLMTVMNRRHEIALLLSLGAYRKEIKKTFFYLGAVIGGSGIIFGVILGFFGIWMLGSFDIIELPADVYGSSKLPMELSLSDFASIIIGAIFIVIFSSFYPAHKATKIDPLTTLRNE
ncbi:MAG: hypothetical protein CR967_04845 [Proteobacteria bacterium]|nr:MAG: hypothetical protein CR967_04845 [Pseudomonadota bacterium]